jgi:hypothetical protein
MAKGRDTSKHPNRGVSRHSFSGGGYVDIMRSPELQRDIDSMKTQDEDEDGPLCNNCTDDMGEALEWHDRETIHPSMRVPCVGCGAK